MKRARETEPGADRPTPSSRSSRLQVTEFDRWRERSLCPNCRRIQPQQTEFIAGVVTFGNFLLDRQLSDMLRGATSGCLGCCDLYARLEAPAQEARREAGNQKKDFRVTLEQKSHATLELNLDNGPFGLMLDACRLPFASITQTPIPYPFKITPNAESVNPDGWRDRGGSLGRIPRVISSSALSDETRQIVMTWLKKCTSHDRCRPPSDQELPTRVLELKQPGITKLVESKGMRGQYLILSHCWGAAANVYKTTQNLLPKHKLGIDLDKLPANFRDAIAFTVHLGYHYLWIDSLCIVQDYEEDWKNEAPLMGSYYKNATLMLSATDSPNATAGFLHDRRGYCSFYTVPFGKENYYTFRAQLDSEMKRNWDKYALNKRAWTMQERFLAPRVLHFLSAQMFFECGSEELAEGYWYNNLNAFWTLQKWRLQNALEPELARQSNLKDSPETPEWDPYKAQGRLSMWYDIIKEYSKREITFSTDRMLAIAGLAKELAHPSLGRYLAGIWEAGLFTGLSWVFKPSPSTARPSKSYIAPSWSWLSTNGSCELDENLWPNIKRGPGRAHVAEYNHWARTYAPKLMRARLQSGYGDPYSSVTRRSYITVRGYCRSLYISKATPRGFADGPNGVVLKQVFLDHEVLDNIFFYFSNPPGDSKEALLLQICKGMGHNLAVYALILMEDQEGQFRRIGLAKLENYNLCGFFKVESRKGTPLFACYLHPRQRDHKEEDMRNTEWQQGKWKQKTLRLY